MKKDKTRIIHVPRRFIQRAWSGTEAVVLNLCRQQRENAFEPEIHTTNALTHCFEEEMDGIPIRRYQYVYPFFGLSKQDKAVLDLKGGNLVSMPLFCSLAGQDRVRLYHAHVTRRLGAQVLSAARMRGRPFVVTLHGDFFDLPAEIAKKVHDAQRGKVDWGKAIGLLFGSRKLLERADAVICVGFNEYQKARETLTHNRVFHLANGVEERFFAVGDRIQARANLGLPAQGLVFGCLSRITPRKGQDTLIRAFAPLAWENPNARLLICGPTVDADFRQSLRTLVKDLNIEEQVVFYPAVEPESPELAQILAAFDCFVLPSLHESFGITALEAWAAGLPVIASATSGPIRLVEPDRNGLLFPPGDHGALNERMDAIAANPDLRRQMGEAGKRKVTAHYSWANIARQQERIYQEAEAFHGGGSKASL